MATNLKCQLLLPLAFPQGSVPRTSKAMTLTRQPHSPFPAQSKGLNGRSVRLRSVGGDAVQGWVDLAKLVSGGGGFKSVYKELAQKIGSDVYIDVNGWHLFLRDVTVGPDLKLNQALAQQIGEASNKGQVDLQNLLKQIPVKIGGGKTKVSLHDAIPSFSFDDLQKIVDDFERD